MKNRMCAAVFAVVLIAGCGGGGDGGGSTGGTTTPPQPTPTQPTLVVTQQGQILTAAPGDTVTIAKATVACSQQLCTAGSVQYDSAIPFTAIVVHVNGQPVPGAWTQAGTKNQFNPTNLFNFGSSGTIELSGVIVATTTVGQSASISMDVTGAGNTTVVVKGDQTVLAVNKPQVLVGLANATPFSFVRIGAGDIASFQLVCPAQANGGCKIVEMDEMLFGSTIPAGTKIDTYVGSSWWYQAYTTSAASVSPGQLFILNSPIAIPAGQTVTVAIRSSNLNGWIQVTKLTVTDAAGKPIALDFGSATRDSICKSVLDGVYYVGDGCKG